MNMNTTFSIGMRTVQRHTAPTGTDYCRQTLQRLLDSGTLQSPLLRGLHINHGEGISPNRNGCHALLRAALDRPSYVLFLEDDVDMIDDLLPSLSRWLHDFAQPDVLAYPLSCFYHDAIIENRTKGAWDTYPIEKYYGSQGFVMRPDDARNYAYWLQGLRKPREQDVSFDIHLGYWHRHVLPEQKYLVTPSPCFLDHTGEYSAIGPPGSWERVGRVAGFAGRHFTYTGRK